VSSLGDLKYRACAARPVVAGRKFAPRGRADGAGGNRAGRSRTLNGIDRRRQTVFGPQDIVRRRDVGDVGGKDGAQVYGKFRKKIVLPGRKTKRSARGRTA
jgi:hypothetical protein